MPNYTVTLSPDELTVIRRNLEEYRAALTAHVQHLDPEQPNVAAVHLRISNINVILGKLPDGQ